MLWVCPVVIRGLVAGLNEYICRLISCSGHQEGDFLLGCETGGLEELSGKEVPNGVLLAHKAKARLVNRGVMTSRVHRGMAVEA